MKTYDECVCEKVQVEPEKKERNLKYLIKVKDWLNTPVTREENLRTLIILGQIVFDITIIIKSRKRK